MGRLIEARGHPVYTMEATLRFILVRWPRLFMAVGKRIPSHRSGDAAPEPQSPGGTSSERAVVVNFHLHRLVSLFFMYLMLQVLGLLWAFLLNAGCILMLDLANAVMDRASWEEVSLTAGLCTFYVTYCIFRIFIQFGNYIGLISWQSLDDFPLARKVVARAAEQWNMLLLLLFLPQTLVAFFLLATPPICETQTVLQYALVDAFCNHTPLKFLTEHYERPRSILTQMLFFGIMQFTQILLHQFPDWRCNLMAVRRRFRRPLHAFLLALIFTTMPWLVRWLGFHAGYDWFRVGYLVDHQWYSRALLLGWSLWVHYLALLLCTSGKVTSPPLTDDNTLQEVFMNLKLSFIIASSILFLRGCFHPKLGFLESQQEWVAITIVMPILYAVLFAVVKGMMRMTWALSLLGGACSFFLALLVVMLSGIGGPGTLILVWLHVFGKCVELLGSDELGIFGAGDDDNLFEDDWTLPQTPHSHGANSQQLGSEVLDQYFSDRTQRLLSSSEQKSPTEENEEAGPSFQRIESSNIDDALQYCIPEELEENSTLSEQESVVTNSLFSETNIDQIPEIVIPIAEQREISKSQAPTISRTRSDGNIFVTNKRLIEGSAALDRIINRNKQFHDELALQDFRRISSFRRIRSEEKPSSRRSSEIFGKRNEVLLRRTRVDRLSSTPDGSKRLADGPNAVQIKVLQRSLSFDSGSEAILKNVWPPSLRDLKESGPAPFLRSISIRSTGSLSGYSGPESKKDSDFSELMYKIWIWVSIIVLIVYILVVGTFKVLAVVQETKRWFPQVVKFTESASPDGPLFVQHALVSNLTLHRSGPPQEPLYPRYGLCGHTWEGLSLVDYALLSELAYFDPDDERVNLPHILEAMFPPSNVEGWWTPQEPLFKLRVPSEEYRRHGDAQFLEFYSAQLNLSVISIKGTDIGRIGDFVEDIKLYTEPVVFMILSSVFPTIRMWSDTTASYMVDWLHETQVLFGLRKKQEYYNQVSKYINSLEGRKIVLTGHSLGGGLARIAGALERVPSIAFSPPGLGQSYRKFHLIEHPKFGKRSLIRSDLFHEHVSVVPENDPVARVDTQVGNIQNIMCKSSKLAIMNACHMLEGTICELLSHCGDHRNRFTGCQYEYNLGSLVPFFWGFIDDYIYWLMPGLALLFIFGALAIIPEI